MFTTFEGDNIVLLQLVAKGLLTSYRDAFGDLDTLGTLRFVARQVASTVAERTSARTLGHAAGRRPARAVREDGDLLDRARAAAAAGRPRAARARGPGPPDARRRQAGRRPVRRVQRRAGPRAAGRPRARRAGGGASRSPAAVERCTEPGRPRAARPAVHAARAVPASSRTAPGTSSTAGSPRRAAARSPGWSTRPAGGCGRTPLDLVDGFGIPDAWLAAPVARRPPSQLTTRPRVSGWWDGAVPKCLTQDGTPPSLVGAHG